ncbi:MAG TPA: addiction module protein [Rhizomicrobium sp.]|nr:addiction module protein [Rhizomicrobium sp.]
MPSTSLKRVLDLALELPASKRAELAQDVLASLDGEADSDSARAWKSEIAERMERFESGHSKLVDAKDAIRRIDDRLRR